MLKEISYHKSAGRFIASWIENNPGKNIMGAYSLAEHTAKQAREIARSISLEGMDYQNVITATWFWWPGTVDILTGNNLRSELLEMYFQESGYPGADRLIINQALAIVSSHKEPVTEVEKAVADALNSELASPELVKHICLLHNETLRLTGILKDESNLFLHFKNRLLTTRLYTQYALNHYAAELQNNQQIVEKKIQKLLSAEHSVRTADAKQLNGLVLTNKETDDFFKIAFRNYNHLVSVADSKASLLIHVNSIIISVMLAFVVSKIRANMILLWPAVLMLTVSLVTIFLSVLASRPQKNILSEDKKSHSYQRFFFGGFDLIDPGFRRVTWEDYLNQLTGLFSGAKETVWLEVYKETFNVRKVLSKKFNYLSIAYWVFITGLVVSITAFVIAIQLQKIV